MKSALKVPEYGETVRGLGKLVRVDTPPPVYPPDEFIFEKIDATTRVLLNGRHLKDLGSFHDINGTAVANAIAEAQEYVAENGIDNVGPIEVVVEKRTYYTRRWIHPLRACNFYAKEFVGFVFADRPSVGTDPLPEESTEIVWRTQ